MRIRSYLSTPAARAALLALAATACAPRPDPRVKAAQDFRDTAFQLIADDESQARKLNSLRIGMHEQEVLLAAGPPTRRENHRTADGNDVETWTYDGNLKNLGVLIFDDGTLTEINVQ